MSSTINSAVTEFIRGNNLGDGWFSMAIDGVAVIKTSNEVVPHQKIAKAGLCVVAQGSKQTVVGEQVSTVSTGQALIVGAQIPAVGRTVQASRQIPFVGLELNLDIGLLREIIDSIGFDIGSVEATRPGRVGYDVSEPLAECITRLIRLNNDPKAISILFPSIMRELYYRLLSGPGGAELARIAHPTEQSQHVADAIHILRGNFSRKIRIKELAAAARMSPSSFYQHFKNLTSMTPLQYQKQMRLLEARRLVVANAATVTQAALGVGYESLPQFSREYLRMFGVSPKRDAMEHRVVAE